MSVLDRIAQIRDNFIEKHAFALVCAEMFVQLLIVVGIVYVAMKFFMAT